MPFFKRTSPQRRTFSLLCNSLCFPSIRVKIWEVWISPAVPLGFYVHTDARKFSPVYKFRYIRTRVNLHTDVNLFSPVYKFCCIRTHVFSRLFNLYLLDLLSAFPYSYQALICLVVLPIPSSLISSVSLSGRMFAAGFFEITLAMDTLALGYVIPAIRAHSGLPPVRECSS